MLLVTMQECAYVLDERALSESPAAAVFARAGLSSVRYFVLFEQAYILRSVTAKTKTVIS
jgi:hypothetical protein